MEEVAFDGMKWLIDNQIMVIVGAALLSFLYVFITKRSKKPAEVVRKRPMYVSSGGKTTTVEVEDTVEEESKGDDNMAKKLEVVYMCSECENVHETKTDATECCSADAIKMYQCSECGENYDNPFKAEKEDSCDGKFKTQLDTFHMIDGTLQLGRMSCTNKDCGWEGAIEDAEGATLETTKKNSLITGETVFTTSNDDADDVVLNRCPECGSEYLVFVPKAKPAV